MIIFISAIFSIIGAIGIYYFYFEKDCWEEIKEEEYIEHKNYSIIYE